MEFFDLVNISERYMELINPSSPEKVLTTGRFLRLAPGRRVLDFGCGFAEPLVLWAERYGIAGTGIDIRPAACERARQKIAARGLAERLEIVCGPGADYAFDEGAFDAAVCLGASFVFGGFENTLAALRRAIHPGGRIALGEPYWRRAEVPAAYAAAQAGIHQEHELLAMVRAAGLELECIVRASQDDWDRYESDNWHGLIRWREENPSHPDRTAVTAHLQRTQDEYLRYGRECLGWAIYVLAPAIG